MFPCGSPPKADKADETVGLWYHQVAESKGIFDGGFFHKAAVEHFFAP